MRTAIILVVVFAIGLIVAIMNSNDDRETSGITVSTGGYAQRKYCDEAKDAAHYIAALSRSPYEATRVADRLIADRKYPALGDEGTALIAAIVTSAPSGSSPNDIVLEIEQSGICRH